MNEKINVSISEQQGLNVVLSNATVGTGTATSDYNDLTNKPTINGQVLQGDMTIIGTKGDKGDKGDKGEQGIQGIQGERGLDGKDGINGTNGIDGTNGISPTVTVATNTDTEYTLSITDATGTITTPNLKGKDGTDGTSGTGGGTPTTYIPIIFESGFVTCHKQYLNQFVKTGNRIDLFFNFRKENNTDFASLQAPTILTIPTELRPKYFLHGDCLCLANDLSSANSVSAGVYFVDGVTLTITPRYPCREIKGHITWFLDITL